MARTNLKRTVTPEELASPLVPYEEAVLSVLSAASALPATRVGLMDALGLVCAEAVVAEADVPAFASSAMDGYAVRAADTVSAPVTLRLLEDLPAGTAPTASVEPGTASKIMTGAPVPHGADAVVPWEDTTAGDGAVVVRKPFDEGRNVRPRGEDISAGTEIIAAGDLLGPVHVGVLASLGRTTVSCVPRPRVAVLSTGDELATPGTNALAPGQVYESNSFMISAMLAASGALAGSVATIGDDRDAITAWLSSAAASHDLIVTSGGASVGEHDWLRDILAREGSLEIWRVAIKPGKPIAFGAIGGTRVFSLPGNPGSAFVGMHAFVSGYVRALAGRDPSPRWFRARLSAGVRGSSTRTLFCRVRLVADGVVEPLPAQSSVVLSNLIPAEAFAIVPPGGLPSGAEVRVEPLT